jgi:hypothetical protein
LYRQANRIGWGSCSTLSANDADQPVDQKKDGDKPESRESKGWKPLLIEGRGRYTKKFAQPATITAKSASNFTRESSKLAQMLQQIESRQITQTTCGLWCEPEREFWTMRLSASTGFCKSRRKR